MKVTQLVVSRTITVNIGNYESEKVEVSQTMELSSKDDVDQVLATVLTELQAVLYTEEKAILKSLKKRRPKKGAGA